MKGSQFWIFLLALRTSSNVSIESCCTECFNNPDCSWCFEDSKDPNCSSAKNEVLVKRNEELSSEILIKPQEIDVKLLEEPRCNVTFNFIVGKQRLPFNLDVYFLIDLSISMLKHRKNALHQMEGVINHFTEELKKGFNIRFGYGSFVDKNLAPFASRSKNFNCHGQNCQPYGFKHHLSLTSSLHGKALINMVNSAKISGDVDNPEGSLDALLQVMLCKNDIGWIPESKKVIIVVTDQHYHQALDGKLIGLLYPNFAKCQLDHQGKYYAAHCQDYPSLSQLNYIAVQDSFQIIFSIPKEYKGGYEGIPDVIRDASVVGHEIDASEIINMIENVFEGGQNEHDEVRILIDPIPFLFIQLQSSCFGFDEHSWTCPNVRLGDEVMFSGTLSTHQCISNPFDIEVLETDQKLRVNLSCLRCNCDKKDPCLPYIPFLLVVFIIPLLIPLILWICKKKCCKKEEYEYVCVKYSKTTQRICICEQCLSEQK